MSVDNRTDYLIHGYIHRIEQLINHKIIPLSIIQLCIRFYLSLFKILFIKQHGVLPKIYISELDDQYKNHYEFNVTFK